MSEFEGKVALVTGAGSGIGADAAQLLSSRGARVVVADIDLAKASATVDSITAAGGEAVALAEDTSKIDEAQNAVDFAVSTFGRLDIAINNAGIAGEHASIVDGDPEIWRRVIDVNLLGVYYALRAQLAYMIPRGSGSIVNLASIVAANGQADTSGYVASKHGVIGLTKTAALEVGNRGVRVNAVGPGFVRTPMLNHVDEAAWAGITSLHPIGRVATPREVSELIAFLASDRASFITGSYHLVDGGYSAQ